MRSTITFAALLALASQAAAQALTINTPTSLIVCQPYAVTWLGGTAPYYVSVVPGGQQSAAALTTLGDQPTTATSFPWTVDIAAGTSVTLRIVDSLGNSAASAQVTIIAGSSTACLDAGTSSSATGASSAASSASSSASSASSAVSSAVSSSAASSTTTTTTSATSTTSVSTNVAASSTTPRSSSSTTSAAPSSSAPSSASGSVAPSASPTGAASHLTMGSVFALVGAAALAIAA